MKKFGAHFTLLLLFVAIAGSSCKKDDPKSDNIWQGPDHTFTKNNFADWTLEANQDRITTNVWLTRADNAGIFNVKTEVDYEDYYSPKDTEWAYGTTSSDLDNLDFYEWEILNNSEPPDMVGDDMVLHLISDDVYLDIKFTAWTTGDGQGNTGGGGFTYIRSTKD